MLTCALHEYVVARYNAKGDLVDWIEYSISYYHNLYITNETMRYDPTATNGSDHWYVPAKASPCIAVV